MACSAVTLSGADREGGRGSHGRVTRPPVAWRQAFVLHRNHSHRWAPCALGILSLDGDCWAPRSPPSDRVPVVPGDVGGV